MKTAALLLIIMPFLTSTKVNALTNSTPAIETVFDAIVTIKSQGIDVEDGSETPGFCNGAILSEKIILTAAHCLAQSHVLNKKVTEIQLGKYKYVKNPSGVTKRVGYASVFTQIEMSPDFIFKNSLIKKMKFEGLTTIVMPHEDMAFIKLKGALPLKEYSIKPLKVMSPQMWRETVKTPHPITVVTVNYFAETASTDVRRQGILENLERVNNFEGYHIRSQSVSRVEPLDSGAPAFIKVGEDYYIVGLTKGLAELNELNWDVFPILVYSLPQLYFNN
ncbi:MAG: trypsin-like serine protease [Oligoflexia bacterium]|nr:trypsin-like serine protease [Oligoflexia bacterium]